MIDDDSSDSTSIVCGKYPVKYVKNNKRMLQSYDKNIDIKKSTAKLVAFIDDDCVANSTWLEELARAIEIDEKRGIVGGRIIDLSDISIPGLKEIENNFFAKYLI